MLLDPTKTVRQLAVEIPNATRVFEKTKIDYCCGGDQLVSAACVNAGIDLRVLEQMLTATTGPVSDGAIDFQKLSAFELIQHILDKHHTYTRDEMERLEALANKVVNAHGANHPELLSIRDLLRQMFAELKGHMFKEEQILFPFIVQLELSSEGSRPAPFTPFGTVGNPIRMMMFEHDNAGEILRELRKLSHDYQVPEDGCLSFQTFYEALAAFEQDLHQHIHLENNILFPMAVTLEGGDQARPQES